MIQFMDFANESRFIATCQCVGIQPDTAQPIWTGLFQHYSEPHRSYHNLTHIDRMLGWFIKSGVKKPEIELAIWFHDVIYEPLRSDNEEKSAEYFTELLGSVISVSIQEHIHRLILATNPASPRTGNPDEDLIIDIDLTILGSSPEDYENYRSAVRQEYASVPDQDFNAGRRSVLQSFLSKKIYATKFFAPLEHQARSNIQNELESLESFMQS